MGELIDKIKKDMTPNFFDYEPFVKKGINALSTFPHHVTMLKSVKSLNDLRFLMRYNLFVFLTILCHKSHLINKWAENRCAEVQASPNEHLDLWPRDHYKSSIVTIGKSIQDICATHGDKNNEINPVLINELYNWIMGQQSSNLSFEEKIKRIMQDDSPHEITIGIFSCTRTLAQSFLWEIKKELEQNADLQDLYPEIFYKNPDNLSDKWSIQAGINVKRKSIRKEATVEAWGLVKGQPTSKHFSLCVYDDIITHDIVKTLYLTKVATNSWENSLSLSSQNGFRRYVGTRKHYNDTYSIIIERKAAKLRLYTPFIDNDESKGLALFSPAELNKRRKSMGEATFYSEYLQQPLKSSALGLNPNNIIHIDIKNTDNLAIYFFCDPSKGETKDSDYTMFGVFGVDKSKGLILLDGIRDRLLPSQKWEALYSLYNKYPQVKRIFYEENGLCNDLSQFKERAIAINHPSFCSLLTKITQSKNKNMRILSALEPLLEQRKFFTPKSIMRKRVNGEWYDLINILKVDEMAKFPFSEYDDIMDVIAEAAIKLEKNIISGIVEKEKPRKTVSPVLKKAVNFENF